MDLTDKILNAAYGKDSVTPNCVAGDSEAIQAAIIALHNEGLIKILGRGSHSGKSHILNFEITDKGREIVDNGGYAQKQKTKKRRRLSRKVRNVLYIILGAVITETMRLIVEWLNK